MPHDEDTPWREPTPTLERPTMLSSCAMAATAAEARFRVPYPNSTTRASRVFALDQRAAEAMCAVTEEPWKGAHFLTVATARDIDPAHVETDDLPLSKPDGSAAVLSDEIDGADVVVLIASNGQNGGAAEVIAREAWRRGIMVAALVLGGADRVVNSLRPFASVLVVAKDDDFIPAMLTALRA